MQDTKNRFALILAFITATSCSVLGFEQTIRSEALINGFSGGPYQVGKPADVLIRGWLSLKEEIVATQAEIDQEQKRVTVTVTKLKKMRAGEDTAGIQTTHVGFTPNATGSYVLIAPSTGASSTVEVI